MDAGALAARIRALGPRSPRRLIAVAGPPAAGKSTLAEALARQLGGAALVPMDGFHLDDCVLESRGLRSRKGAPETFDAAGFAHAIARLSRGPEVVVPVFDRSREIAIAGARVVGPEHTIAVVEGNYLLLDRAPWDALRRFWDLSVMLRVPEAELERRSMQRWRDQGVREDAARAWVAGNDMPNMATVLTGSHPADIDIAAEAEPRP